MVQFGYKNTKYKNGRISPEQSRANILIFKYIQIFVDFSRAYLFGYSFVVFLSCQIYWDINSLNTYGEEYIWTFICPKKIIFVPHWLPGLSLALRHSITWHNITQHISTFDISSIPHNSTLILFFFFFSQKQTHSHSDKTG